MLNTSLVTKFQCGGFTLGPMRPFATVTSETQQVPLKRAILEGKLLDITGTDMAKGVKTRHGETSAIAEQDTGKNVVSSSCRNQKAPRAGARGPRRIPLSPWQIIGGEAGGRIQGGCGAIGTVVAGIADQVLFAYGIFRGDGWLM